MSNWVFNDMSVYGNKKKLIKFKDDVAGSGEAYFSFEKIISQPKDTSAWAKDGVPGWYNWGIEHWGVEPDIMTMAKGSANGIPIGITIATPEVADSFTGLSISTFGGNPVSSVACLGTIEMVEQDGLIENSRIMG